MVGCTKFNEENTPDLLIEEYCVYVGGRESLL